MSDEKPNGYLARHGGRMIENGYSIIPIRRGSKAPPSDLEKWQKIRATPRLLASWVAGGYSRAGVGLLTRKHPFVDLDILDEKMALQMEAYCLKEFGAAPVRIGLAPKRGLLFQTETPFPKINSRTFADDWGDPEAAHSGSGAPTGHLRKVEILGDGQQFVAFHIHPDTGKPYRWVANGNPVTRMASELPTLDEDGGRAIVAEFERLAEERGWEVKTQGRAVSRLSSAAGRKIDHDDVFAADKQKIELSADELRKRLLLVPNADDYDTWFQVGMALWHQYDGEQIGLDLWHEWSETATNYDAAALDAKWETFDAEGKGREPLTARFILKLAQEQQKVIAVETFREIREQIIGCTSIGEIADVCAKVKHIEFDVLARNQIVGMVKDQYKKLTTQLLPLGVARDMVRFENPAPKDAPHWLQGWVYVTQDKSFYNRVTHQSISTEAFNAIFGRYMLTKTEILEGKSVPETFPAPFALNNQQIPVVKNRMYLPGEDDLFTYNSSPYVNSYSDENIPEVPARLNAAEKAAVETVKAHFAHLFHDETDRIVLMDAIAYLVQNPGKRLDWAILLQGTEKDGKSFFAGLLGAVLGPDNVNNLAAPSLEEKFNGWSEGAQVVFFEEIKLHGHNRFDVLNKVKPLITNPLISVRRMQTDVYTVLNTATYFLTTNFRDALPLDDNDSRYFILFSRFQTKKALQAFLDTDPDYYQRLYDALQHPGALRKWLLGHQINPKFSGSKRAPDSKAKAEMVRYAKTDEAVALEEILATAPSVQFTYQLLNATKLADEMAGRDCEVPYGRAMSKLLLDAGFTKLGKVRVGTDTDWFWSQQPRKFQHPDGTVNQLAVRAWVKTEL